MLLKGVGMRKPFFVMVAVVSLAAAGGVAAGARSAAAATQTVQITHSGYKPTSVSITAGDSVVFTNKDTVAHTVVFKTTTGVHCSQALPLVIQPAKSATCTFSGVGKYTFSDAAIKSKSFRGTITVAQPPTLSLTAVPATVVYGHTVTLSGTLASQQSGQSVQLLAQECGQQAAKPLATVTTTTGGAYTYQTKPLQQTVYTGKDKGSTSSPVTVKVHPRLRLGKLARHRYSVRVFAAQSFAGKHATFQRYRSTLRRWVKVKSVLLRANTTGVAPTVITSATFHARIRAGLRVRVVIGQSQVGSCYLAGKSNTIRS